MKNLKTKAFTLVELLVVITILAIISVVAYQNFGGAVDKAVNGRKISDISTIETSLQQYKADKNYFPAVDKETTTNLWGYTGSTAKRSNTLSVQYNDQEIEKILTGSGGGYVSASGSTIKIGYKGTISQKTLGKRYLTKDLYDPELGDVPLTNIDGSGKKGKMIDFGIGRYVYAIYKKGGLENKRGNDYNIAYTIKKDNSDIYITKISGSYDKESCYGDPNDCPNTLIGSASGTVLNEGDEQNISVDTTNENQGIPYPVTDFAQ